MLFFTSKRLISSTQGRCFHRQLFTRSRRLGETELVLTNNAGIFGAHWSLMNHSSNNHSKVHIACFPFWLDRVQPHHQDRDWGQTLPGLPTSVRALLKRIYPEYPNDKFVTWKMIIELRNFTIHELSKMDQVTLHDFRAECYPELYNRLFKINVDDSIVLNFNNNPLLKVPFDTQVYNWVKVPRLHAFEHLPERPHTELYTRSKQYSPEYIMVMGRGLSVVWLQRDFPESKIIVVLPNINDELPRIPSNFSVPYHKILKATIKDITVSDEGDLLVRLAGNNIVSVARENFVSAIGYLPYYGLTQAIPQSQRIERSIAREGAWVAPKNIPPGSLTQSLLEFFEETENLEDTFELQFHHSPSIVDLLRKRFQKDCGVLLGDNFFEMLKQKLQSLDNPVDESTELDLFVKVFSASQTVSEPEIVAFKKLMISMQKDRKSIMATSNFEAERVLARYRASATKHTRLLATDAKSGAAITGNKLTPEDYKKLQNIVETFFEYNPERIREFDEKNPKSYTPITNKITDGDRKRLQEVLVEADKTQKTFSVY